LDEIDRFILLQLTMEEPSRSRQDYADWLYEYTGVGVVVSLSTVSRASSSRRSRSGAAS
jgi:hypothetical protein